MRLASGLRWMGHDLRYAVRTLFRDRGSVALAVLALSLGIGAATVLFSVVYSVLVDAFPFKDSSRVVHFYIQTPDGGSQGAYYPVREFVDYRAQNRVFTHVLGGRSLEVLYNLDNATYRVRGTLLDTQALVALGVRPIVGRDMTEADGVASAPPTFLMSDRMWAERFNRDPKVIGTTLRMNGTMRTLIAILPPRFLLQAADVFFPTTITPDLTEAAIGGPDTQPFTVWTYAHLKPGVTMEEAAANVEVIARNEAREYPERYPPQFRIAIESLADAYTGASLKQMVSILGGAVLMLLMIACSNVANLLLARASVREPELALRAGLGAPRARLVQQPLAESFVLALMGTAIGGLLAFAGLQWVKAAIPVNALPSEVTIRFSGRALLATVAVTMITTLICGLVPALRAARGDLQRHLTSTGKGVGLVGGRGRLRTLLVMVQVTLAIVLLVGAGLMLRTFVNVLEIDPGIDPHNVLVGRFVFPLEQQRTAAEQSQFIQKVFENIRALPGIVAASPSAATPLQFGFSSPVIVPGVVADRRRSAMLESVGREYFEALKLPLVSGRLPTDAEVNGARRLVVVNRQFVKEVLDGGNPLGRTATFPAVDRLSGSPQPSLFEIVGVVGDTRNTGLENEVRAQAFFPYTILGSATGGLVVRTSGDPALMQRAVMQQIWAVDRGVALRDFMPLERILQRDAFAQRTFGAGLLGTFAAIGLILSGIGVFSVMTYTVSLQTRDIGIRLALGAEPGSVVRRMVWRGMRPILAGAAIGIAASYALSRLLANQIYGVTTTDPSTFGAAVAVIAAVGIAACFLPARRASRVDPMIALRCE